MASSVLVGEVSMAHGQLLGLAGPGGTEVLLTLHGAPSHGGAGHPSRISDSEGLCSLHDVGGRVGTETSGENSSQLSCVLGWDAD